MAEIHFLPDEKKIDARADETVLQTSLRGEMAHAHACGGQAQCSTCRVWVLEGLENCRARTTRERQLAEKLALPPQVRLACQLTVSGPIKLRRLVLDDDDLAVCNQLGKKVVGVTGQQKHVAILFSDIRGFTTFSESLPAYDVMYVLNRYFQQMGKAIYRHHGYIDNYMGDGLMAIFGADDQPNSTLNAVRAGLEMLEAQENFKPYLHATYHKTFEIGIGIHYGAAVLGALGYGDSQKPSTIGDSVNLASRIESANKEAGTRFLISQAAYEQVKSEIKVGKAVTVEVKGKSGKYPLFEVTGLQQEQTPRVEAAARVENGMRWVPVLAETALLPNSHHTLRVGEIPMLLLHRRGKVFAVQLRCPHMNLPLNTATVSDDCQTLTCPWHHSAFDLNDGHVRQWAPWPPALGAVLGALRPKQKLSTWPTRVEEGFVWVGLKAK